MSGRPSRSSATCDGITVTTPSCGSFTRRSTDRFSTTRWKVAPRELCKRLRTGRLIRKNKRRTVKGQWCSQITDARPIKERPGAAGNRSESGHLEGDLVIGSNSSQVARLVDRKSGRP